MAPTWLTDLALRAYAWRATCIRWWICRCWPAAALAGPIALDSRHCVEVFEVNEVTVDNEVEGGGAAPAVHAALVAHLHAGLGPLRLTGGAARRYVVRGALSRGEEAPQYDRVGGGGGGGPAVGDYPGTARRPFEVELELGGATAGALREEFLTPWDGHVAAA